MLPKRRPPPAAVAPSRIPRPPLAWQATPQQTARRQRCSWTRLFVCAVLVELALAIVASMWLDAAEQRPPSSSVEAIPPPPDEPPPTTLSVRLHVDNLVLHRLSPRVQACVSLDWWPDDKCDYDDCPWANASLLTLDLADPLVVSAMRALAPVALRVGGSLADQVVYETPPAASGGGGGGATPSCEPFARDPGRRLGFRGGCLPWSRWTRLFAFCEHVDCQIYFSVNALHGRTREACPAGTRCRELPRAERPGCCTNYTGGWDGANLQALLRASAAAGLKPTGLACAAAAANPLVPTDSRALCRHDTRDDECAAPRPFEHRGPRPPCPCEQVRQRACGRALDRSEAPGGAVRGGGRAAWSKCRLGGAMSGHHGLLGLHLKARGCALGTREERPGNSDPTERPCPWSHAAPNSPMSLPLTIQVVRLGAMARAAWPLAPPLLLAPDSTWDEAWFGDFVGNLSWPNPRPDANAATATATATATAADDDGAPPPPSSASSSSSSSAAAAVAAVAARRPVDVITHHMYPLGAGDLQEMHAKVLSPRPAPRASAPAPAPAPASTLTHHLSLTLHAKVLSPKHSHDGTHTITVPTSLRSGVP